VLQKILLDENLKFLRVYLASELSCVLNPSRLKSWNNEYNFEPTIFEPQLKSKLRLKFFKYGLWPSIKKIYYGRFKTAILKPESDQWCGR